MHSYPPAALALVERYAAAAGRDPENAIAFQGAPGANSHRARGEYAPDAPPLPCFSFEDALEAVKEGRAGRAIIPIENSQHGRVADIHFLLPESGLSIVGEHFLAITHCLMGLPTQGRVRIPFAAAVQPPAGARPVEALSARARHRPSELCRHRRARRRSWPSAAIPNSPRSPRALRPSSTASRSSPRRSRTRTTT
jgi:hypothetical protein